MYYAYRHATGTMPIYKKSDYTDNTTLILSQSYEYRSITFSNRAFTRLDDLYCIFCQDAEKLNIHKGYYKSSDNSLIINVYNTHYIMFTPHNIQICNSYYNTMIKEISYERIATIEDIQRYI